MNQAVLSALGMVARLRADDTPGNTGPDFGKASPLGLLVIVLLLLGTFALVWSMNRQLRKVPSSFDRVNPAADRGADTGTGVSGGDAAFGGEVPDRTGASDQDSG